MKKTIFMIVAALGLMILTACSNQIAYEAGSYVGSAQGKNGPIRVEVTFTDDKIESIEVVNHQDDLEYATKAVEGMPGLILESQRLDVDAVSGATLTSRGIIGAVAQCVTDAGVDPVELGYTSVAESTDGQEILITGLAEDKIITGDEIKAMTPVEFDAISVDASGTETPTTGKGVKLEDILAEYGASQKNFDAIVLTATDGYAIEVPKEVLTTRDVIIAYEINGEAVDLRTVIPEERAMYWVKFLNQIEIKGAVENIATANLALLETAVTLCDIEDYKYYDSIDQAITTAQLLEQTGNLNANTVEVAGADGWSRNEEFDTYSSQYIKITGENAPMFIGPDLPEGMRMKDMLYNKVGDTTILSVKEAQNKYGETTLNGDSGVLIDTIFTDLSVVQSEQYVLTGADGYSVEISLEELKKGILVLSDDGVNCVFDGQDQAQSVKGLLYIKPQV
ncbi:FMN-binding protein [Eubacteriaceae bacterium ES3]|nr:FMN-binding protein [Eubacteriaceae bacterium ES3]